MSFEFPHAGEVYSLVAAVVWAVAVILFRKGGEVASPVALNVFKNTLALVLFAATMLALGRPLLPAEPPLADWLTLGASGILGLGVADTLFLMGLNRIGAGRAAIVDCFYSPCVIACAAVHLGETIGPFVVVSAALIGAAVVVGNWEPRSEEGAKDRATVLVGVVLGMLAMLMTAIGFVLAKPVLARADLFWVITVRLAAGAALPAVGALATSRGRGELARVFRPGPAWRVTLPAALVGTYLSMLFWILGMKLAQAKVAALLNQMSTVFTIILAALLLKEPLTRRKVLAVALGFAGAAVIVFERG